MQNMTWPCAGSTLSEISVHACMHALDSKQPCEGATVRCACWQDRNDDVRAVAAETLLCFSLKLSEVSTIDRTATTTCARWLRRRGGLCITLS